MSDYALPQPKMVVPGNGLWLPAAEELFPFLDKQVRRRLGDALLRAPKNIKDYALQMSGSKGFDLSKSVADAVLGGTAFTAATPLYGALYTASIGDTVEGNTAGEAAYTSYARLSLTNNTTIFATGSGTTTYTKTFPSDATKSFATSTGGTSTVTFMAILSGNAGSSSDKGYYWCSVTSVTINSGDTPQLAQNAVSVVED